VDADRILTLDSLSVTLGGIPILRDISFSVGQGDIAWLVGSNGVGKSTLLRAVAALLPYDGDVAICGFDAWRREARSCFTYSPDAPVLYEDLTLSEHAIFASRAWGRPEAEERILAILDAFQLADRLVEFPVTHSRGMQQKLSLALAIGIQPSLVMLDEPYDGLDRLAQPILTDLLLDFTGHGGTVLITTHQENQITPFTQVRKIHHLELIDGQLADDSASPEAPIASD